MRLYLTEGTAIPASVAELATLAREPVCAFLRENPELLTALPVRWEAYQWVPVQAGGFEPAMVGYGEIQECVRRVPA